MMIFIDFDDVLFNTKKFRNDLKNLFFDFGISEEIFEKYYCAFTKDIACKTYNPWNHLKLIELGEGIKIKKIEKKLKEFMKDLTGYIFSDGLNFLTHFESNFICVVSYGEADFQREKIKACFLEEYVCQIKIVDYLKSRAIREILEKNKIKNNQIFFLDDRMENIKDVKDSFSFIQTVLIQRKDGRYFDKTKIETDFLVEDLEQAQKIIENNF